MFPEKKYNDLTSFLKDYSKEISNGFETIEIDKLENIANVIKRQSNTSVMVNLFIYIHCIYIILFSMEK